MASLDRALVPFVPFPPWRKGDEGGGSGLFFFRWARWWVFMWWIIPLRGSSFSIWTPWGLGRDFHFIIYIYIYCKKHLLKTLALFFWNHSPQKQRKRRAWDLGWDRSRAFVICTRSLITLIQSDSSYRSTVLASSLYLVIRQVHLEVFIQCRCWFPIL